MVEPMPFEYQNQPVLETNWSALTNAQNAEKQMLQDMLQEMLSMVTIVVDPKKLGRKFSNPKDLLFCLALKTYTKLSSRRLNSDLEQAKANDFISNVPHFTTLMDFLKREELTDLLKELIHISALPVKNLEDSYAIDSSGFSSSQFGRWFDFKYGKESIRRNWVKAHVMCGVHTNIITSIELTEAHGADSPQLENLVKKTCKDFDVGVITADKAYCSRKNFQIISDHNALPFIPFKKNDTPKAKGYKIWTRCFYYFTNYTQEYLQEYHKRSNVETCFAMIKQKFGKNLMTKNFTSQQNEILLKVLCHNLCCLIQEYHENKINKHFPTETQKIRVRQF